VSIMEGYVLPLSRSVVVVDAVGEPRSPAIGFNSMCFDCRNHVLIES